MVEEDIRINFRTNTTQLNKIIKQLKTLQTKINSLSKKMTKFNSMFTKLNSRFNTSAKSASKLNKRFKEQQKSIDSTRKALDRLANKLGKVNRTSKAGTTATGKLGSSIGLTGFQFGFLGGMALLAGDRLRTFFFDIVREGVEDLGAMNRAVVQSGINLKGFLAGDLAEFDAVSDRIKGLQQQFGEFTRADVANAFEQIGRAVGEDVSIEDIESITKELLTIARIDKTGGAGLAKTSVDLKRVMTQFGITAGGLDSFVDKLVNTNQQGAIELGQLVSSLGFAGAQAQRFGVDLNETLALTGFVFEKSGRKAGAAGRTFGNILDKLASTAVATNPALRSMGIHILDAKGNFNEFSDIVGEARIAFARLKAEGKGQVFESALLEEFGFDKTAARGFLSLVQASDEELRALIAEVEKGGTAQLLSDAIGEGADVKLKTFENEIRNLKSEFAVGLIPAIQALSAAVKEFTGDKEFIRVLKEFGEGIGETVTVALNVAVPIMKFFGNILKQNTPLVKALAAATVILTAALTGMGVIFLVLGAMFSMIRIHENLISRGLANATSTNFLARAYVRLTGAMSLTSIKMRLVEAGFTRMIIKSRLAGLAIRIFSIQSIVSLLSVAAAWVIALAPLIVAVAAFAGLILVMRTFQDEIVAIADELDETGTAGNNFAANMDGLFDFLKTGDVNIFFDPIKADLKDTETRLQSFTDSWNIFLDDLEKSKAFQFLAEQLTKIQNFFTEADANIKTFIENITFEIPDIWTLFQLILASISGVFGFIALKADEFLTAIGFNMPEVWEQLDGFLALIRERFKFIIEPLEKFIETIKFPLPDVFGQIETAIADIGKEWNKLIEAISKNPFVSAILELFGIGAKLGENLGEGFAPTTDRGGRGEFEPDIGSFFPDVIIPEGGIFGGSAVDEVTQDILDRYHAHLEEQNVQLEEQNAKIGEITETTEALVDSNTKNVTSKDKSTSNIDVNSGIVALLSGTENVLINELIRNINLTSRLSTIISETMLMFAHLIAQGNRAAGKLASLKVSASGVFSITDPGVSDSDQQRIDDSAALVGSTRSNEVNLQQTVLIEVNQNNNGSTDTAANAASLADEIAAALAKQVGQITG